MISFLKEQRFGNSDQKKTVRAKKSKLNVEPGKSVSRYIEDIDSDLGEAESVILNPSQDSSHSDDNTSNSNDINVENRNVTFIMGDYVLVRLKVVHTDIYKIYLGIITEIIDAENFTINFLRLKKGRKQNFFAFPTVKDESMVHITEIKKKLDPPISSHRGHFIFKNLGNTCIE